MSAGFKNIVITGASGGLGGALAIEFAEPGCGLLLLGRDQERLNATRKRVEDRGASVTVGMIDVRDQAAMEGAIRDFELANPIDLVVANAGVKTGNLEGSEPWKQTKRVIDVNVLGAIATVQASLPAMRRRGNGRVVLVSSAAALSPQPDLLSYSASKAALRGYGIALRRTLRGTGVGVTLVYPGFVSTPMTDRHQGPTPFVISKEDAAHRIVTRVQLGKATIAFPRRLHWLIWLERHLPAAIGDIALARLRANILPDTDEGQSHESNAAD